MTVIDPYIQSLIDDPIRSAERANKIFLPQGKLRAPERTEAEKLATLAAGRAAREASKQRAARKLATVLDYYAGTRVPYDRIADHTGLKQEKVAQEMRQRGRVS